MTAKPVPTPTPETLPYWQGGGVGELRYAWCPSCERALFPPRAQCRCGTPTEWRVSNGEGTIHSFTIVGRAPIESFRADVPYVIALIDMAESFRIMTNLRSGSPKIGASVRITFEMLGDIWLPQARMNQSDE